MGGTTFFGIQRRLVPLMVAPCGWIHPDYQVTYVSRTILLGCGLHPDPPCPSDTMTLPDRFGWAYRSNSWIQGSRFPCLISSTTHNVTAN